MPPGSIGPGPDPSYAADSAETHAAPNFNYASTIQYPFMNDAVLTDMALFLEGTLTVGTLLVDVQRQVPAGGVGGTVLIGAYSAAGPDPATGLVLLNGVAIPFVQGSSIALLFQPDATMDSPDDLVITALLQFTLL